MELLEDKTIASIVTDNINTAKVFDKYNIDFGFGTDHNLNEICESKGINLDQICAELSNVNPNNFYLRDYNSWKLDLLLQFLIDVHHDKKKNDIKLLDALNKLMYFKYSSNPIIQNKSELIKGITYELMDKMSKEENLIFPYIKKLISIENDNSLNTITNPFLQNNIEKIEKDRFQVCEDVKEIIDLAEKIESQEINDESLRALIKKLKIFYYDIQVHNHIEKNILLPKAIALEKSLVA